MDAQSTQFDSHRFVKRLKNAGLSEEVAEILADEHTRLIVPGDVATKTDVGAVRNEMATKTDVGAVRNEMATKTDVGAVRNEMATKTDVAEVDAKVDRIGNEMATKAEVGAVRNEMATKAEVAEVDAKIDRVRVEMVTKEVLHREIAACEARMEQRLRNAILEAKVSLIKWMITTMMVFSGIVIGAVTALQ